MPARRVLPSRGWRLALYKATFGLVNLGPSPDEIRQAELENKIKSVLRGHYKVGVMGKGGVGKTTVSACVGSVFAELRHDDRVVAIDADTAFGKLGSRVDPKAPGSYWELASDQHLETFADVRGRVGNNAAGLFVLAGRGHARPPPRTGPSDLSGSDVAAGPLLHDLDHRLQLHHGLPRHPGGAAGSRRADRGVVTVGGRRGGGRSDDGLAGRPRIDRSAAADSDRAQRLRRACRQTDPVDPGAAVRSSQGQIVIEVPFDGHLRPGGVIDRTSEMSPATRRRFIEIAAALAEHFPTRDDRSRERY